MIEIQTHRCANIETWRFGGVLFEIDYGILWEISVWIPIALILHFCHIILYCLVSCIELKFFTVGIAMLCSSVCISAQYICGIGDNQSWWITLNSSPGLYFSPSMSEVLNSNFSHWKNSCLDSTFLSFVFLNPTFLSKFSSDATAPIRSCW